MKSLSHVWLFATLWTVAYQAPPSRGFFRQEYWSGLPFPAPGDLPNPGIEPGFPHIGGRHVSLWATREAHNIIPAPNNFFKMYLLQKLTQFSLLHSWKPCQNSCQDLELYHHHLLQWQVVLFHPQIFWGRASVSLLKSKSVSWSDCLWQVYLRSWVAFLSAALSQYGL